LANDRPGRDCQPLPMSRSNRTAGYDARIGAQQNLGYEYAYDGLDRLEDAVRGNGGSVNFSAVAGGEQWNLDMLGNWDKLTTDDASPFGSFDVGSDSDEDRVHNGVNELTERDGASLTYDHAGNLRYEYTSPSFAYRYTHDAWNRLVAVDYVFNPGSSESVDERGEYEYNGLHQRIVKRADTDDPVDGEFDQQRFMYYDASWRMCEEQIWDDWTSGSPGIIDRHIHYTWGPRYIDDIAFRRIDNNGDEDYIDAGDAIYYHLTDAQFSTKVVIDSTAAVVEWVKYTPYGEASHHHKYDMDNDRDFDSSDRSALFLLAGLNTFPSDPTDIDEAGYRSEADINRDGTIDINDYNAVGTSYESAIGAGLISTTAIDNIVGYDAYRFNAEARQYQVRYRVYDPGLGRWVERDPLGTLVANLAADVASQQQGVHGPGTVPSSDEVTWAEMLNRLSFDPASRYDDGCNLYQYGWSNPLGGIDPAGGPWGWLARPLVKKTLKPVAVAAGGVVGRQIGRAAVRKAAQARRKAKQAKRRLCRTMYATYKAACAGIPQGSCPAGLPCEAYGPLIAQRQACLKGRRAYLMAGCDYATNNNKRRAGEKEKRHWDRVKREASWLAECHAHKATACAGQAAQAAQCDTP